EVEGSDNDQNDSFDDEGFITPKRMFDMGISDTVKEHEQDINALMRRIKGKGWNSADGSITRFCSVLQLAVRSPSLSLLDGKMRIVKAFPPREVQTSPERN
ncbi:hypothetical protein Tco_0626250, partial [Tanacetum coccineum]